MWCHRGTLSKPMMIKLLRFRGIECVHSCARGIQLWIQCPDILPLATDKIGKSLVNFQVIFNTQHFCIFKFTSSGYTTMNKLITVTGNYNEFSQCSYIVLSHDEMPWDNPSVHAFVLYFVYMASRIYKKRYRFMHISNISPTFLHSKLWPMFFFNSDFQGSSVIKYSL